MPRRKQYLVLVGGLALVGAVVWLAYRGQPQPPPERQPVAGLAWLPAEAGLVAGINLAEVRQQAWLLEMIRRAGGEESVAPDYQAFVEATGFDYTRDLDRLWVGVFGPSAQPIVVGVAEGRFAREKVVAHARLQGGRMNLHQGIEIHEVRTEREKPPARPASGRSARSFAFAFLDETHVAFASDPEGAASRGAARVVDCWQGSAPAVSSDELRRARVERVAAGRQVWVVDNLEKWQPAVFQKLATLPAVVVQASLGLGVSGQGLEVEAEARCREPRQAERLRDNLRLVVLAGRLALARQPDKSSQALSEVLGNLTFAQEGDTVQARVTLPPDLLATLLGTSASAPGSPVRDRP